jgi:hypothetical protein
MTFSYGWKEENETLHNVDDLRHSVVCLGASDVPDDLDIDWFQDDQGAQPFCHAHMRTGAAEILAGLKMGEFPQYSRYFAAITDMFMDGDDASTPQGASIGGSLRASIKYGEALEKLMPYEPDPRRYSRHIDPPVLTDAQQRGLVSLSPKINDYATMMSLMTSGRYVIGFGLKWTTGWANLRNVATAEGRSIGGQILGGHAVLFFGWKTIKGDKWPILHNSHDGWGVQRRCAIPPNFVDYILNGSIYGAWGMSDIKLNDFTPAPVDFNFRKKGILV